jgi:5-methylcytosine-specific restriction endonuclease McrA
MFKPLAHRRKHCSWACYKLARGFGVSDVTKLAYMRRASSKRRALIRQAGHEPYTEQEIFNRDRWRCGLCGGKVPKKAKAPDPLAASIDHILPISRGGSDTRANVQCAHLACNIDRKNRGGSQMVLFG